jgi:hypothetical protein
MADKRRVVVFDDFTKGEFGSLNPIEYGDHGKSGMWTGTGMMVLPDGSLCPQPIPKAQTTTGLSGTAVDMGMGSNGTSAVLWAKMGNKIYQSGPGPTFAFTALSGTSGDSLSFLDRVAASSFKTYAVNTTGGLEVIDHSGASIGAVGGSPPLAVTVCQYGDRLMLGGAANANRLWFSAAGNFASWPVANFIDVGDTAPIVALKPMRGFLLIAKSGGTDETWWILRGVPGVNAVLRRSSRFQGPVRPNNLTLLNDNRVAFGAPSAVNNDGGGGTVVPASFDGTAGRTDTAQIGLLSESLTTETYRMVDGNDVMLRNNLFALIRRRGAWTRHGIDSLIQPNTTNFGAYSRTMAADPAAGTFYVMNAAGTAIYKWHPYAIRPAFAADTDGATPADAPTFTLPEWRVASGDEVCVQAVVVAFKKWNVGSGNNTFNVSVTGTGTYSAGASSNSDTPAFSEAASSSSVNGTLARVTYTVAPVWGNGFLLTFANIRGVAIRSVTVVLATRPMQGVA